MKKLFIGNLSWSMSSDDLRDAFASFGDIDDAVVITERDTGRSRGFGFVTFVNAADADAAIAEMHEKDHMGRPLIVNEARERD